MFGFGFGLVFDVKCVSTTKLGQSLSSPKPLHGVPRDGHEHAMHYFTYLEQNVERL